MTLHCIGSGELGTATRGGGVYQPKNSSTDQIVSSPALSGTYSYQVDPVNGDGNDRYGWRSIIDQPDFVLVSFIFQNAADFSANVAVCELSFGFGASGATRTLVLTNNERLAVFDAQDDEVGTTGNSYITAGTTYNILWYYDQRSLTNTRDIVWLYRPAASKTGTGIAFVDGGGGADTITDTGSGFGIFNVGMEITVSGSASNDGTYTIVSVVAGTITLATGTLTAESAGANVTVDHAAQWYNAIDVTGHGDGSSLLRLAFGSDVGKGALPVSGGPFYVDDMCLQDLERSPNADPLSSITAKIKRPDSNGTDTDFDSGSPDFNDVDEIPGDGDTTKDEGDAVNEKVSYTIANADGGDAVLAVQVVGMSQRTANTVTLARTYVLESATRDTAPTYTPGFSAYSILGIGSDADVFNQVNGVNLSETLFNTLEAGLEITLLGASTNVKLTQIGLEYAIKNTAAQGTLPTDYPSTGDPVSSRRTAGVALGSGNPMMI